MTEAMRLGLTDAELQTRVSPYRSDLLQGQTVLVSGGGSGLGKAIAWEFGKLGANVAICGRKADKLQAAAAGMEAAGITVLPVPCNIRSHDEVQALYTAIEERLGGLDILVNNAGGQFPQPAIDFSPKGWNAVIDTNLNGTWYMMQTAARLWKRQQKPGSIVNIVAVTDRGMPGVAHTCAARAGVVALTKTIAVEWAPERIRVNCIAPGAIDTEGQQVYTEETRRRSARSNPMMRFGDPFDIADATIFVSGATGKFITGETVVVDGGGHCWGEFWVGDRPPYFDNAR